MAKNRDTIYHGGVVLTMEGEERAEAVRVQDGRIVEVGSSQQLLAGRGEDTTLVDLKGKTMLPAFIDPHSHITALANSLAMASLSSATSQAQLVDLLKAHIQRRKPAPGEWVIGFGYDHNSFEEGTHPTAALLDQVSRDHPIVITHVSGHMGVANTAAMKQMGITAQTPNPQGGMIGRLPNGEPSGYLEENAFMSLTAKIPKPTPEQLCKLMVEGQQVYLSYGITTAQDGMTNTGEMGLLKMVAQQNSLTMDVVAYADLKHSRTILEENPEYVQGYCNHLRLGGYKIFLDGSPQGRTAWMSKPYLGAEADYCGYPIYRDEEVVELARQAIAEGRQLLCHCNGDAASEQYVSCYGKAAQEEGRGTELRPVMIHAQTVREDQLERMVPLGMMPSFFVAHTYYWGDVHLKNFGEERASRISPVHTAIEEGLPYTFHQDSPVVPPDMLHTIWCAVNRVTKSGRTLGPQERITPMQALRGVTCNAAYQYFEEDSKGSIRPGKRADLVILDKNPLEVDLMAIKDIQVLETIKDGVSVYQKG